MLPRTNSKASLTSKSSVLDPLKSLVGNVQEKNRAWKRRNTVPSTIPMSALEAAIEPQRKLAAGVKEMAQQLAGCFENVRATQRGIMRGVQEYLGFDLSGVDESLMALVQACSGFFESCDAALSKSGLPEVCTGCERVLRECEQISGSISRRDETYKEWKHYETKVNEIMAMPERHQGDRDREKLLRNREKLANAKQTADESRQICEEELRMFVDRRTVHARASLHALLRAYARTIAGVCRQAAAVAQAFDGEFQPGTSVEMVGLQRAQDLNGVVAVVESAEEGTSQYNVALSDGSRKRVPAANLIPLDAPAEGAGAGSSREAAADCAPRIRLSPAAGPCAGCEVEVSAEGLAGPIQEVLVGGERAEILASSTDCLRVRVPPSSAQGCLRAEVRTAGWRQCVASEESAFRYYETVGFRSHGLNVALSAAPGSPSNVAPAIATRTTGLVQGIALTDSPLTALPPAGTAPPARYYFEAEVLEVLEQRSSRTLALGFAWPLCVPEPAEPAGDAGSLAAEDAAAAPKAEPTWHASGRLPENALELPRAFVVGGDLPKVHLAGKELGKVSGWRPLKDVVAGTVLGALLEVDVSTFRITVFQDAVRRFSTEAAFPEGWAGAPHGVVDVCGTVRCVQLRQGVSPPEDADAAAADAAGEAAEGAQQAAGHQGAP